MKVTIDITQQDIEQGLRGHAEACPLYLAASRVLPVMYAFASHLRLQNLRTIHMPCILGDWVHDFDKQVPVKPIRVTLDVPESVLEMRP